MNYRYIFPLAALCALPIAALAAPLKPATLAVQYKTLSGKKANRYNYSVKYPAFGATGSPVARLANQSFRAYAVKQVAAFLKDEADTWREYRSKEPRTRMDYDLEITPTISVARPDLVSVYFVQYSDVGGAHSNSWFVSQAFGMIGSAAKKLALSDLFAPGTDPYKALSAIAMPELRKRGASSVVEPDPTITTLNAEVLRNWVLTPTGITLLFSPYDVASFAEGAYLVRVKYADILPSLRKDGLLKPFLIVP